MKHIKAVVLWVIKTVRAMSWFKRIVLAAVIGVPLFSFIAIEVTGQPAFCNSCHVMEPYYESWKTSTHNEVNCLACHLRPGVVEYAKGKIMGLAQAVDCIVGRYGTKPNGSVADDSCLRSGCHSTEELVATEIDFGGIKFTHAKHIDREVDGIQIKCGTCHSHFKGDEHFAVNTQVCFTCHFLTGDNGRLVDTDCQSCHEVPDKVIERGMVKINHSEFVSYEASCSESCHQRQIKIDSKVEGSVCLTCHSFGNDGSVDSAHLHEIHSTAHHKVECFACHGDVQHKASEPGSVTGMLECQDCHSDTHGAQRTIFAATEHPNGNGNAHDSKRILSPMFLTHVKCKDCHIDESGLQAEGLSSIGTVARAVPRACDNCHEPGTGDRYIPFWQGQIKSLYGRVEEGLVRLKDLRDSGGYQIDEAELDRQIEQIEAVLSSVKSDGSWGVHNLKYTEAMLLTAIETINSI